MSGIERICYGYCLPLLGGYTGVKVAYLNNEGCNLIRRFYLLSSPTERYNLQVRSLEQRPRAHSKMSHR